VRQRDWRRQPYCVFTRAERLCGPANVTRPLFRRGGTNDRETAHADAFSQVNTRPALGTVPSGGARGIPAVEDDFNITLSRQRVLQRLIELLICGIDDKELARHLRVVEHTACHLTVTSGVERLR
jgi:hypothetical protein